MKWFRSYLTDRRQKVSFKNVCSRFNSVDYGIPQGSILGPLLFLIFINDMPCHLKDVYVSMYADDTCLKKSAYTVETLQTYLRNAMVNLCEWCKANHLVINIQKSNYMIICNRQKRTYLNCDLIHLPIYDSFLNVQTCVKVLGVSIDNSVCWIEHIDKLTTELSQLIGLLYRIKCYLSFEVRILFYNSYILPHIDYCINVWGNASQCHIDKLQVLQNRAARVILDADLYTSSQILLKRLKWMSIAERKDYQTCILLFKGLNGMAPESLNIFKTNENMYALRESTRSVFKVLKFHFHV